MLSHLQEAASSTPGAGVSESIALGWYDTPQDQLLFSAPLPLAAITCTTIYFITVRFHSRALPQVPGWSRLYRGALTFPPCPQMPGEPSPCEGRGPGPGPHHGTTVVSAGKYGQLGHGDNVSSDQPRRVEYLVAEGLRAEEVVCGPWTTYVCVLEP